MKNTVDKIPFLRLTVALSIGIIAGAYLHAGFFFLYGLLVIITAFALWLNLYYGYQKALVFGLTVQLFFIFTGLYLYERYNEKPEFKSSGKYIATINEILQEKPNSYQSVLLLNAVSANDSLLPANEKVLAYFEKDHQSKFLVPGQVIIFSSSPREIRASANPFEFNYKNYMAKRKIYRQVYLPSNHWLLSGKSAPLRFSLLAEQVRLKLLNIYRRQDWSSRQMNVLSALTLGYKRGLSPETKNTFSSAGAMHILAVSGLHTGIIFLVLTFMFGFLRNHKSGRFLFILLVVSALWSYAFVTGLSPSVMRAATMFSFLVIGQNLRRQANIYNTLAASAFFILLVNPNNLFEAGFQLSYSAVFGIVFLQPRFEKLILFRFRLPRYFWSLFTVSLAAQIATFPVATYYFNQFPIYFWLSNLVVIPVVALLIPLCIAFLTLGYFTFFPGLLSKLISFIMNVLLDFLNWVEHLPYSAVHFYISKFELLFLLSALLFFFLFTGFRHKVYFNRILISILLFLSFSLVRKGTGLFRNEIIWYDYSGQNVVHFISGKRNYVVTEEALQENDRACSLIENTVAGFQLQPPLFLTCSSTYHDSVLYLNKGLIVFNGQVVHFHAEKNAIISPFAPDMIIGKQAASKMH